MSDSISRREFFLFSLAPALAGTIDLCAYNSHEPRGHEGGEIELRGVHYIHGSCLECGGLGKMTCPACEGTGLWTEVSEHAGLLQREAARPAGWCAWCGQGGEVQCTRCDGVGDQGFQPTR
jgi:hypothetical protein